LGETESIKAGTSILGTGALAKLAKLGNIVGDIMLVAWVYDEVKGWVFSSSKSEDKKREAFTRSVIDPAILVALATSRRSEIVRNMLDYRGLVYAARGTDMYRIFGTSLLTCSDYMGQVAGMDQSYFTPDDIKSIVKDVQQTELNDLLHVEDLEPLLEFENVDQLKNYKLVDYFAYFLNLNGSDFAPKQSSDKGSAYKV